jgi:hypothetical protein
MTVHAFELSLVPVISEGWVVNAVNFHQRG